MSMRRFSVIRPDPAASGSAGVIVGEGVEFTGGPTNPAAVLTDGAPVPVTYASVDHVCDAHLGARVVYIDAPDGQVAG